MYPLSAASDIRPARCSVRNPAAFLQDLRVVAAEHNTRIICFNVDMIAGRIHAATAVARAVRAFEEGVTISNTLEMEALLFAAGAALRPRAGGLTGPRRGADAPGDLIRGLQVGL